MAVSPGISVKPQVIVLAAGKGTRMCSDLPKALHRLCGLTLLERTIRALAGLSPSRVVVVIGYGEQQMRLELERLAATPWLAGVELEVAVQSEQLGTGHAAKIALPALATTESPVLILPGDSPLLRTDTLAPLLIETEKSAAKLSLLSCKPPNASGFGRIIRSNSGQVEKIVEHKDASATELAVNEINTSIYLASSSFLREALEDIGNDNAQGEYYLTDIVSFAVSRNIEVFAHCTTDAYALLGANSRYELIQLETLRRAAINCSLMEQGVGFENPMATYIDEDVRVGPDSYIGAGTRLQGQTEIGSRVVLEGDCLVRNSSIASDCLVKLGCRIEDSTVAPECQIGPFAQLRPGSVLHKGVHLGNFVETKNSVLHEGVKANHLTYLGDAEIGAKTNVGAGTITCNYDGVNKYQTTIESDCFIGSNTALVAPVTVGSGSYLAAGSTITQDVPAKALAVARAKQRNIEGWAERKSSAKNSNKNKG